MCHCDSQYIGNMTHPKGCKNALSNTFPGSSENIILMKTPIIFPVHKRQTAPLKSLDSIFCFDSNHWKSLDAIG